MDDNEFIFRHDKDKAMMLHALFPSTKSIDEYAAWIATATKKRIEQRSWSLVPFYWFFYLTGC